MKDVSFTHVMGYKANHKQVFCFQRAPTATEMCMYSAVKLHRSGP